MRRVPPGTGHRERRGELDAVLHKHVREKHPLQGRRVVQRRTAGYRSELLLVEERDGESGGGWCCAGHAGCSVCYTVIDISYTYFIIDDRL